MIVVSSIDANSHGDIHQRIDTLNTKILQTTSVDLLLQRGQLFHHNDNLAAAWKDFKAAKNRDPMDPDVLYFGAKIALKLEQLEDALILAQQFLLITKQQKNPAESMRAYPLLSRIYHARNKGNEALFYLKKSINLQTNPTPAHWVELANLQLKHEGYQAALTTLKQALSQSGTNFTLQQRLIVIATEQQDYQTALSIVEQQLETSVSLRELVLLVKKFQLLQLIGNKIQATLVKQKARLAFQQLPNIKKNIAIAKGIRRELRD